MSILAAPPVQNQNAIRAGLEQTNFLLPTLGITCAFSTWHVNATRDAQGSFDIFLGTAVADAAACKLLKDLTAT
jgi:hypothetical protein